MRHVHPIASVGAILVVVLVVVGCVSVPSEPGEVNPLGPIVDVRNHGTGSVTVTPWAGGPQLRVPAGGYAQLPRADGPVPPWQVVVVDDATGRVLIDEAVGYGPHASIRVLPEGAWLGPSRVTNQYTPSNDPLAGSPAP